MLSRSKQSCCGGKVSPYLHDALTDLFTRPENIFNVLIPIDNTQHDCLDLDNTFIHNFMLDDCIYCHVMILCNTSTMMVVKSDRNM